MRDEKMKNAKCPMRNEREGFTPNPSASYSHLILHLSSLPFHAAFFGRVDLRLFVDGQRFVEQIALDVIEQKILRVGVGQIETVMINNLRLLLQPARPAWLTNLERDSLP